MNTNDIDKKIIDELYEQALKDKAVSEHIAKLSKEELAELAKGQINSKDTKIES